MKASDHYPTYRNWKPGSARVLATSPSCRTSKSMSQSYVLRRTCASDARGQEIELVMELEAAIPVVGMEMAGEIAGDTPATVVAAVEAATAEADFDVAIEAMLLLVPIADMMLSLRKCYGHWKFKNGKAQKIQM